MICLYGHPKALWTEIMVSVYENLPSIRADLCSLAMDYQCLDSITWLELIYSSRSMKWLSIGARFVLVRLYKWDCKFIYESIVLHVQWPSLEAEVVSCLIHWVLISPYYVSSWIKSRPGRWLYPLSKGTFFSVWVAKYRNK